MISDLRYQLTPDNITALGSTQVSICYNQLGEICKTLQGSVLALQGQMEGSLLQNNELKKINKQAINDFDDLLKNLPMVADFVAQNDDFDKLSRTDQGKQVTELIWACILQIKKINDYTSDLYKKNINLINTGFNQKKIEELEGIQILPFAMRSDPSVFKNKKASEIAQNERLKKAEIAAQTAETTTNNFTKFL
jgi:hypothetical protein